MLKPFIVKVSVLGYFPLGIFFTILTVFLSGKYINFKLIFIRSTISRITNSNYNTVNSR